MTVLVLTITTSSGSGATVTDVLAACEGASGWTLLLGTSAVTLFAAVAESDAPGSAGNVDNWRSGANTFFVGVGFGVVPPPPVCLVTVVADCNEDGEAS